MNVVLDIDDFKLENVFFQDPVNNTVMDNSDFIRTSYSTGLFTLNGIFLKTNLNTSYVEKYFNKYKCMFDKELNEREINKMLLIEKSILQKVGIENKRAAHRIQDQLASGNIKLFTDNLEKSLSNQYIFKISGIWETETDYGVTYKFMNISA
jgi:endo-beta-N-acetylglucosaminidase D